VFCPNGVRPSETVAHRRSIFRYFCVEMRRFFKYLAAAGTATVVDTVVYQALAASVFRDGLFAALCLSYAVGLLTNFLISKYLVFHESEISTQRQFFRFTVVAGAVFVANFYLMKLLYWILPHLPVAPLVEAFGKHTAVRGFSAGTVAVLSFFSHKFFSFSIR
ncbi:MAG: GtrA family protein, partial [Bacteroidia bacterium]|nr:GtrA family protein [Bacteroidia bacterium]MDW8334414.1 GtrA family protein [Bacteroidia bacterium]